MNNSPQQSNPLGNISLVLGIAGLFGSNRTNLSHFRAAIGFNWYLSVLRQIEFSRWEQVRK
jgi:hypothetical protein